MDEPLLLKVHSARADPRARVNAPPTQQDDQEQRDPDNEPSKHETKPTAEGGLAPIWFSIGAIVADALREELGWNSFVSAKLALDPLLAPFRVGARKKPRPGPVVAR